MAFESLSQFPSSLSSGSLVSAENREARGLGSHVIPENETLGITSRRISISELASPCSSSSSGLLSPIENQQAPSSPVIAATVGVNPRRLSYDRPPFSPCSSSSSGLLSPIENQQAPSSPVIAATVGVNPRRLSYDRPPFREWREPGHGLYDSSNWSAEATSADQFDESSYNYGVDAREIHEFRSRTNLLGRLFDDSLVMCRTCPQPAEQRYFLRQPRSWKPPSPRVETAPPAFSRLRTAIASGSSSRSDREWESGLAHRSLVRDSGFQSEQSRRTVASVVEENSLSNAFANLRA